jgi:hypothetical protein
MAKIKTATPATPARRTAKEPEPLGPGLHPGVLEMRSGASFRVRLMDDSRRRAVLGDGVDPALADECLRTGRLVILCDTKRGVTLLGALQTAPSIARGPDGSLCLEGKTIRIRAEKAVVIEAGPVSLSLEQGGTVRAEGDRMVIDMGSIVRVLSALVELP